MNKTAHKVLFVNYLFSIKVKTHVNKVNTRNQNVWEKVVCEFELMSH